jgi:hypothetical protein
MFTAYAMPGAQHPADTAKAAVIFRVQLVIFIRFFSVVNYRARAFIWVSLPHGYLGGSGTFAHSAKLAILSIDGNCDPLESVMLKRWDRVQLQRLIIVIMIAHACAPVTRNCDILV